jgi:spore germination cell wall hydrolase CwlJ-like protein
MGAIVKCESQRRATYQQNKQQLDAYQTQRKIVQDDFIKDQIKCLGLNIYHEARSSSLDDQKAVALVTINRAKSNVWPNTICEVVYQNKQFSWTHTIKDPTPKESLAWQQAHQIAKEMYAHRWKSNDEYQMADFTSGANHYYQPSMVKTPIWAKGDNVKQTKKIGQHIYLKIEF